MAEAFRDVRSDRFGKIEDVFYADDSPNFEAFGVSRLRPERRIIRANRSFSAARSPARFEQSGKVGQVEFSPGVPQ